MTLSRDSFAAICAVEGLQLSPEALSRRADFDVRNLSNDERRAEILKAYRKDAK